MKTSDELLSSFYADDTSYAGSDNSHDSRKRFAGDHLQEILVELEEFCSKWRIGLNAAKTKCLFFKNNRKRDLNEPNLYLRNELLKFEKEAKFLGVLFDEKLSFENHILEMTNKCKKRLNLLKSMCVTNWGENTETILYSYRTFIRPVLEYGAALYAYADQSLLDKIQAIETTAIKIAFDLPPWTLNYWCYQQINFTPILDRLQSLAKSFIQKNKRDFLIQPLIDEARPSINGNHSSVFKILNW